MPIWEKEVFSSFHKSAIWTRDGPGSEAVRTADSQIPQAAKSLEEEGSVSAPLNYQRTEAKSEKMERGRLSFCFDFKCPQLLKMRATEAMINVCFFFFGNFLLS